MSKGDISKGNISKVNYNSEDEHRYDDIINLPHHESPIHPRMPLIDRAAQFSPFAALTGYEDAINETERLVDERIELDEDTVVIIDERLQQLHSRIGENPSVMITYFVPDIKKDGGRYITVTGKVRKIDEYEKVIILKDGSKIPISDIVGITID